MRLAAIIVCLLLLLLPARAAISGGGPTPSEWFGAHSPYDQFSAQVIRGEDSWRQLWAQLRQAPPQAFDAERDLALAVFLGLRRTGGYSVTIVPAGITDGVYLFAAHEQVPAAGSMVTQALTTPFRIIVVPKRSEPVVFLIGGATGECLYIAATERARAEAVARLPALPVCAADQIERKKRS
jgi:hypothetical protein